MNGAGANIVIWLVLRTEALLRRVECVPKRRHRIDDGKKSASAVIETGSSTGGPELPLKMSLVSPELQISKCERLLDSCTLVLTLPIAAAYDAATVR